MADVSSITGYGIHAAFSNYGGYAGSSSTTSGVGGVGQFHHHHRSRANDRQGSAVQGSPTANQASDLLDIMGSINQAGGPPAPSGLSGAGENLLTGNRSSTLAASLAGAGSAGNPSGGPGQLIDTLV